MKGNNELHLNEATVIEALQEYMAKRMPDTPIVVSGVKQTNERYGGPVFVVSIKGPDAVLLPLPGVTA